MDEDGDTPLLDKRQKMSESDGRGDETEQPQSNTVLYLPLFLLDICADGQKLPEVTIGSISIIPDSKKKRLVL